MAAFSVNILMKPRRNGSTYAVPMPKLEYKPLPNIGEIPHHDSAPFLCSFAIEWLGTQGGVKCASACTLGLYSLGVLVGV